MTCHVSNPETQIGVSECGGFGARSANSDVDERFPRPVGRARRLLSGLRIPNTRCLLGYPGSFWRKDCKCVYSIADIRAAPNGYPHVVDGVIGRVNLPKLDRGRAFGLQVPTCEPIQAKCQSARRGAGQTRDYSDQICQVSHRYVYCHVCLCAISRLVWHRCSEPSRRWHL